jgi:hypothetical protein
MQPSPRVLTHTNLQRLLDAIGTLYRPIRPEQLPSHLAGVLRRLIPGEFHGVSVVVRPRRDRDRGRRNTALYPAPADWESLSEIFANQYTKFPLRSIRESGDLYRPLALSDIASRRSVESLDLYHDYYRVLSVADDLSINFGNLSHRVCLAVLRAHRGFSTQDRAMLAALRPHLELAYRYARALASFQKTTPSGTGLVNHALATGSLDTPRLYSRLPLCPGSLRAGVRGSLLGRRRQEWSCNQRDSWNPARHCARASQENLRETGRREPAVGSAPRSAGFAVRAAGPRLSKQMTS